MDMLHEEKAGRQPQLDRIAVLKLGEGRTVHCKDFDAAKAKWARDYGGTDNASIDVFFPVGVNGVVVTYRYDADTGKWVKS